MREGPSLWSVTLAAFVVASLALLVSLGSAVFAKRGADETRALRAIESQRRHTERSPALNAQVEQMNVEEQSNQGQWHRLWLILETSEPLDSMSAEILDEPDVWFADGQTGVQPGVGPTRTASWGALPVGKREAAWRLVVGKAAPPSMRLLLTCSIGDHEWPVLLTVDLPATYDVANSVW